MSTSPIHVHVQDNTPLHVHVKKPKKSDLSKRETKRNTGRPGSRVKTKVTEPWIPAPGRTSQRDKFKWDSEKAHLEINSPKYELDFPIMDNDALRQSDLATQEDNRLRSHISEYEKKIESLMAEVGTLKNEAKNLNFRVVSKNCKSCSGDVFIAEMEKDSRLSGDNGQETSKDNSRHYADCSNHKIVAVPDDSDSSDSSFQLMQDTSPPPPAFEMEYVPQHPEANNLQNRSKVSFREPILEYYHNKKKQAKNKCTIDSSPVPRVHNMSFEEWGRSFGIVQTDPTLELKKVEQDLEEREELLEASRADLDDKQRELRFLAKEYEETEKENVRLRKSMEKYQDDLAVSLDKLESLTSDEDALHRQLVQVEVCGAEAGKQVAALRDIIQRLKYEKRLSHSDVNAMNKQRELFLQKLDDFETSNRTVRRLLQTEHKTVSDVKRLESQRDMLMKKLADSDSEVLRIRSDLIQRSNELEQLVAQVNEEKNHARTLNELNKSVETTRAHLQRELRTKEMENNRLHVQLKNMERDTVALKGEAEKLSSAAKTERESLAAEKDGLKRAARTMRNRAEKAEDALKDVEMRLADRERKLDDARSQADAWRERYQRTSDDKARLEDHVKTLADKVNEHEAQSRTNDLLQKNKEDETKKQLDRLTSDNVRYRSELERYKTDSALAEERCRQAQQDAASLRADIRQQESIEADLRAQLRKAKNEAEEALLSVEKVERNSRRMREEGCNEIEKVREQMLERMKDLQPLPELLKETEMKLQDAQDKLKVYEQRSAEQTRMIADLTNKDGIHGDELTTLKQRIGALNDENRALEARLQILHVKLDDRDLRVKESVLDTVNKDERLQQLQLKLEEVNHERESLKRQLEAAVSDSRKAVETEIDKSAARDRANQARIVDLETNITRLKTDIATLKRNKEDTERRHQSKLQDARDRLEQAESTNRSMRNYVNFLKKSYTNVFGSDSSLTSTPIRSGHVNDPQSSFY